MNFRPFSFFLVFLLLLSLPLSAQKEVVIPELKEKQKGFFFRISTGIGTTKTDFKEVYDIRGFTIPLIFHLGYQTSSPLGFYLNYSVPFLINPEYSPSNTLDNNLVTFPQFGGGALFRFGKGNNYLFADGNLTSYRRLISDDVVTSGPGFGLNIGWGYDHNIVRNVNMGGSIYYHYSTMKDDPAESPVVTQHVGMCLSFRFGK